MNVGSGVKRGRVNANLFPARQESESAQEIIAIDVIDLSEKIVRATLSLPAQRS